MKTEDINLLNTLDFGSYILPNMYAYYAEAAAICFEENNFNGAVSLKIEQGDKEIAVFHLTWSDVSQQVKDMHNDLIYETEYGAYCIAFLIIHHLTDYKVIRRSKRKTGFDYWLGKKEADYPFTDVARLEVSGILKGKSSEVSRRIKVKKEQITQSDSSQLPAYIIVTEFKKPLSKIFLKND
jgi:predicted transcriptional regulator